MPSVADFAAHATLSWHRIVDIFFPPRCAGCHAPGAWWCEACQASVRYVAPPTCARCGQPDVPSGLCVNCQTSPLTIESIRSMALFDGRLRHAIHTFKYQRVTALADPLGEALARFWLQSPLPVDVIVPVPLHPSRQRERGYNQAALLADRVGRATGLPVRPAALRRTRATAAQMSLAAADRKTNVAGAFHCAEATVRGAAVVLVDDVCTTGATLDACAVALKAAGAAEVCGLTLARAA